MSTYTLEYGDDVVIDASDPETMLRAVELLQKHEDDAGFEIGVVDSLVVAIKADMPVAFVGTGFNCPECGSPLMAAAGNNLSASVKRMLDDHQHFELAREPEWFDHPLRAVLYGEHESCTAGAPVTLENDRFEVVE